MNKIKKYSKLRMIDSIMLLIAVVLSIAVVVFLIHREWLDALMNAIWAFIAWLNYRTNVRLTTAEEIIEIQDSIIDGIRQAIKVEKQEGKQ